MTETKQVKPKFSIPKPISQALLAGAAAFSISFVIGVPVEYIPRVAVAGATYSLFLSWKDSRFQTAPKKKRKRSVPLNHARGSQDIHFDYAVPSHLTRETYIQAFVRKLPFNRQPIDRRMKPVERPGELDEFVFHSQGMQLREVHVKLFLKWAQKHKKYGKGLGARQWVVRFDQCPAWYQELSPLWYYAAIDLLKRAGNYAHWHLIVEYNNGWRSLVSSDLRLTMSVLRWYEWERRK